MDAETLYGKPELIRDCQGDVWQRYHSTSLYDCTTGYGGGSQWRLDDIVKYFGPIEQPNWSRWPND